MNSKWPILLLLLTAALHMQAQFLFPSMQGRNAAMGGCFSAFDPLGVWNGSLSGLGFSEHSSIALNTRQSYLSTAFSYENIDATYVAKGRSHWLADYTYYGNNDYNEQRVTLGYGIAITNDLSLGASFDYLNSHCSDPHYATQRIPSFSLGISYRPTKEIAVAFDAINPAALRLNTFEHIRTPSQLSLGVSYHPCPSLIGTVAVEKKLSMDPTLRFGLEYSFRDRLFARAGFISNPSTYTFGIGYCQAHCKVDAAAQVHSLLGLTPQLSVTILL